jgi:hypothetical protein
LPYSFVILSVDRNARWPESPEPPFAIVIDFARGRERDETGIKEEPREKQKG